MVMALSFPRVRNQGPAGTSQTKGRLKVRAIAHSGRERVHLACRVLEKPAGDGRGGGRRLFGCAKRAFCAHTADRLLRGLSGYGVSVFSNTAARCTLNPII
jgi:hypothetical protein